MSGRTARRAARVAAQAKVNLLLRVLARESSGYHQIETLFIRLELADAVTVRVGGTEYSLDARAERVDAAALGPAEDNLAYRAALAYTAAAGWPTGFAIELDKRIPVRGGLGGGSADAGAVLRVLNHLAPRPMPEEELLRIATSLGADVPFLTARHAMALAWGRGERMLALPPLPPRDVVIVIPPFGIATAEAYRWVDATRVDDVLAVGMLTAEQLASWASVEAISLNEFEPPVFAQHPRLADAAHAIAASGAALTRLSGSGATVFGLFEDGVPPLPDPPPADTPGWRTLLTRTADRVVEVESVQ